ncbi:hypothetical protein AAZX31_15G071800 [Glycine max]|nr:hypothetical protein JHK86_041700 [Glycine max]KAG4955933.1 hypothetical protein JHK85_042313 [Glycine max]KAG5115803.1 hypothetical protein JHK84_041916 [Glycine max]KAH1208199.1 hypothetical protein GmHk_15G043068 [Glycine max]
MGTPSSNPLFIFFLFFFLFYSSVSLNPSDLAFESTYARLCNHHVPAPASRSDEGTVPGIADELRFQSGYFAGGDHFFNRSVTTKNHASFRVTSVRRSASDGVFELRGRMLLQQRRGATPAPGRSLRQVYPGRRVSHWGVLQWMRVSLSGFWSQSSGNLCMFGIGSSHVKMRNANVVLKLRYPRDLSLLDCLISGTLESFDDKNNLQYFEPISILALSQSSNYKFTMAGNEKDNGCGGGSDGEGLSLGNFSQGACTTFLGHTDRFELEYGSHCGNGSCNPVGGNGELPNFMLFHATRCVERQKVQMLVGFPDSGYQDAVFPFHPNTTLVSEGMWDEKENRLCAVACRILNFTESLVNPYVGDCKTRLSLRFPAVLSLRNRSTVLGQIWSDKVVGESGYFSKVGFQGSSRVSKSLQGFLYKYADTERVRKSCAEKMNAKGKGNTYPDGYSSDMAFSMLVTNSRGQVAQGYSSPLSVCDQIYSGQSYGAPFVLTTGKPKAHATQSDKYSNLLNVSYTISLNPPPDFKFGRGVSSTKVKIGAEGIYNRNTGVLCMIGCQHLRSTDKILIKNETLDCEIMVNVQFPPLNAKGGESLTGTIESTRQKSDPYYFDPLQLSSYSIYRNQADASIWRMDFELIMVLVSNTLACVFVGLQLLHVKKHPDVLPYISVVMLAVITLGHMIPLILNFEALFMANHSVQNTFLGSGGWLEVNEVVVRMVTMVAFLLELRLVQLTWSSRQGEGSHPGLWDSEKKALYITLPLYIGGGLTAWLVHISKTSHQKRFRPFRLSRHKFSLPREHFYRPPSLWEDFKSYAGLLLDGFLLPQILLNIIFNSEAKALASSFYVGTTIVRILPHAYDLYRAHSSAWYLDLSYIYANHRMDFYSTAWDIIIPLGGILFALLVYFQQRFGSRCILPKRFRESTAYEKVPVIGNDDL